MYHLVKSVTLRLGVIRTTYVCLFVFGLVFLHLVLPSSHYLGDNGHQRRGLEIGNSYTVSCAYSIGNTSLHFENIEIKLHFTQENAKLWMGECGAQ